MHVLKLDSDGLFFSVLFCSSFCPSSSAPPHPHVPNRRLRVPFPQQTQNRMTDRRTRGLETCPHAAATAAPTAAAPRPPSRPHRHQRLLLLAVKRYQALLYTLVCVCVFVSKEKWKKLETPVFSLTLKSQQSWLQAKPCQSSSEACH